MGESNPGIRKNLQQTPQKSGKSEIVLFLFFGFHVVPVINFPDLDQILGFVGYQIRKIRGLVQIWRLEVFADCSLSL